MQRTKKYDSPSARGRGGRTGGRASSRSPSRVSTRAGGARTPRTGGSPRTPRSGEIESSKLKVDILARRKRKQQHRALDKLKTEVYVSVNVRACYVKIEDDGYGITRDDLVILGQRHASSKSRLLADMVTNGESLGFRGEALASLSDVSLLEIRTKARGMPNAYCKIIKGSKCLFLGIDDQRQAVGTTVVVRELFYNQPVRRKYMQSSPKRVVHSIKKCVLRIALVYPRVLFKVTDIASEDELLCTIPCSSPLPLISDGFGDEVSSSLQEVTYSDQALILSGYISGLTINFSTKGPIHNLLNNLAASFQCSLTHHKVKPELQRGKRHKTRGYPAFLLNLSCPPAGYDLHFEPSKTVVEFKDWSAILALFEKSIKHFWEHLSRKPLQVQPLSPGNNGAIDDGLPVESANQEEGPSKRFKLEEGELDMLLHQNTYTHSSITNPMDVSLADAEVDHKQGMLSEDVLRFSWLKACQGKVGYRGQSGCPSKHNIHNSHQQWSANIDSLFENDLLPERASWSEDQYAISDREFPEDLGSLRKGANRCLLSRDPLNFIDNCEKHQFPAPSFTTHGKLERVMSHSFGCEKGYMASCTNYNGFADGFDHLGNYSRFHDSVDAAESGNTYSIWHSIFQEKDNNCSHSVSVIEKSQSSPVLDLSSKGTKSSFSCEEASSYEKYMLHDALISDVLATDSICGFSEKDWYLGTSQSVSTKTPRTDTQIFNSRGHLPPFSSASCTYVGRSEDVEILASTQDGSDEVTPTRCTKTELDFQFDFCLERNLLNRSPSYERTFGKCSSSVFNDGTGWSPSESSNMHAVKSPLQIQGKGRQSLWDQLDFQNSLPSKVHKVGSRRSCSAPPFYKGKYRFSTLNDHLSTLEGRNFTSNSLYVSKTAQEESTYPLNGLSQAPLSEPCPRTNINEISQSFPGKCSDEKESTHKMEGNFNNQASLSSSAVGSVMEELEYPLCTLTKWRTGTPLPTGCNVSPVNKDDILSITTGLLHLCATSLIPESISKDCLENARVLLQLDRKFIPVMARETLVIIDQHAADERIRLEELREKVLSGEGASVTYLDSKQELVLPEMGYQLLQKYADQIQKWGWICDIHSQFSESFAKNVSLVKRRRSGITLIAVPCILGINLNDKDLIEFIEQLVETDGSSTMPPSVHRILNSKACRGAIMFGDSLLPSECSLIVEELKATSLCFQCAHGRPTTVPLLNVASLREQLAILETENGGQEEIWHGLRHHTPSIERARMRLETAKRFHGG